MQTVASADMSTHWCSGIAELYMTAAAESYMTADTLVPFPTHKYVAHCLSCANCMASVTYAARYDTRPSRYDTSPVLKAAARTCYRHLTVQRLALLCFRHACVALQVLRCSVCITGHAKQAPLTAPGGRGVWQDTQACCTYSQRASASASQLACLVQGTILYAAGHNTV